MGRINLKQNSGVRTTDHAAPITNPHTDLRLQGISAMQRASNSLANGIAYVGQAIGDIARDQLQMENEIAVNGAQIELLKKEQAFNDEFEKRMVSGEFKDFKSFQDAYVKEYSAGIESPLNQKFQDDGLSDAARHALAVHIKRAQATNFARLGGSWKRITTDNMVKGVFNQAQEFMQAGGDIEGIKKILAPLVDNGYISRETAEKSVTDFTRQSDDLRIKNIYSAIKVAETPEEIDTLISTFLQTPEYNRMGEPAQEAFDIFSRAARADATQREAAKAEAAAHKKEAEENKAAASAQKELQATRATEGKAVEGLIANIDLAVRENAKLSKYAEDLAKYALNRNGAVKAFEKLLETSHFTEDEKAVKRRDFFAHLDDAEIRQNKAIKAKIKQTALDALDAAMKNEGFIAADILKDEQLAKARKEAELIGSFEALSAEQKAEHSRKFFDLIKQAMRYNVKDDEMGQELVSLMRSAQIFTEDRRMQAMQLISDQVKNVSPENWSAADKKKFNEEWDEIIEEKGNWGAWRGEGDKDKIMALDLYNRVLRLAIARNLSLTETVEELKKDPYYQEIFHKTSRAKAEEFSNGRR